MNKSVAIIIPCRNEELYIEKCINSILNSNYPIELIHVYVCDGISDDKTIAIVKKLSNENPQIKLLVNQKQTTPFALNLGLKAATQDVKIILGAHAEVTPNFIKENVITLFDKENVACAGGIIDNVYENNTAKIIGLAMSSQFGVGNAHFRTGVKDGFVDTVAFGAYKKEIFEAIGYFDEDLVRNQDDEFNFRLLKNGFKIYLSQKIRSNYYVRGSFSKLFKQYYQYGYWKVFVNQKHKTITTLRQIVPLLFVCFLLFGSIFSIVFPVLTYVYLAILLSYVAMAFFFAIKKSKAVKTVFLLAFTFFELHLSYGLGYLLGVIEFLIFRKTPSKKSKTLSR